MEVSEDIFRDIFVNSDLESDIDFYGFEVSDQDGESESNKEENNSESGLEYNVEWMQQLSEIDVENFKFPTGKTFPFRNDASQLDVFAVLFDEHLVAKTVEETNHYAQ